MKDKMNELVRAIVDAEEILMGAEMDEVVRSEELKTVKKQLASDLSGTVESFIDFAADEDNTFGMASKTFASLVNKVSKINKLYNAIKAAA